MFAILRLLGVALLLLAATATAALIVIARLSLPADGGSHAVAGLKSIVEVDFDALGNPRIRGESRDDAYSALGYVHARDRLFQMDLLRRSAAGRLAEIFGKDALQTDIWHRVMGFEQLADAIMLQLPREQLAALASYTAGVNQALEDSTILPLEFIVLGYRPDIWRQKDSMLAVLSLTTLSYDESAERMASVMRRALPLEVVKFLTPESDCYNELLAPRNFAQCNGGAAPFEQLAALMLESGGTRSFGITGFTYLPHGSNAWAVAPSKTRDGRAILANDMHLPLEVPNIWYRAEVDYKSIHLEGLTLPGVPLLIAGSNGQVAWGLTSIEGDFSDLVRIEVDPSDPMKYLTPEGSIPYKTRTETIPVRGAPNKTLDVRETIWGPVLPQRLLGDEVAVHWTALDPGTTNLDMIAIDDVSTTESAKILFSHAGGLPLNVIMADRSGNIAWSIMGKLPKRFGADGLFSESWADGSRGWRGYYSADELPSITNPPSGFLVNANQRMLGAAEFTPNIGHDFSGGFRAWRVTEQLRESAGVTEQDMLSLQLDTDAQFYRYYRSLALRALDDLGEDADGKAFALRRYIEAWNGRADVDALGLPLLVEFRQTLIDAVISPIVARCRQLDPSFIYYWSGADVPLQHIVDSRRADLLPDRTKHRDWPDFLRSLLFDGERRLREKHRLDSISDLKWGKANRIEIRHAVAGGLPLIGSLFNMPLTPLAGCPHCVRFLFANPVARSGANARLVVAPGREQDGIVQMVGGQSGQIGSEHYSDQHTDWATGRRQPLRIGDRRSRLVLTPRD